MALRTSTEIKQERAGIHANLETLQEQVRASDGAPTADQVESLNNWSDRLKALDTELTTAQKFEAAAAARQAEYVAGTIAASDVAQPFEESRRAVMPSVHQEASQNKLPANLERAISGAALRFTPKAACGTQTRDERREWAQTCLAVGLDFVASNRGDLARHCTNAGFSDLVATANRFKRGDITGFRNDMGSTDPAEGFQTAWEEWTSRLIDLRNMYGVARQYADVVPMNADTLHYPKRTGEIAVEYPGENTATSASQDVAYTEVLLTAYKAMAYTNVSSELTEDSIINMMANLASVYAWGFAKNEDDQAFLGTHANFTGIIPAAQAGAIYQAPATKTSVDAWELADFIGVIAKIQPYADAGAAWFLSRKAYWTGVAPALAASNGNAIMDLENGVRQMLLGYPVVLTNILPDGSQAGEKFGVFGNLSQSTILGDRRGFSVAVDSSIGFREDQLVLRGTMRHDIQPHDVGDATNAGSYVVLQNAAS